MLDYHSQLPHWLVALLKVKFFNACIIHEDVKKNVFCLDCCEGICPHCSTPHRSHRLLQIRRYVYHDVIRLGDAEKLMDCSFVQSYTTNSAKVVFLNQRPQTRPCKGSSNTCIICDRGLQDSYLLCSIYCKLQHIVTTEGNFYKYIYKCESIKLPEPGSDSSEMTPDTALELGTESSLRGSRAISVFRSTFQPVYCGPVSVMNRRKSTPQRSPLY